MHACVIFVVNIRQSLVFVLAYMIEVYMQSPTSNLISLYGRFCTSLPHPNAKAKIWTYTFEIIFNTSSLHIYTHISCIPELEDIPSAKVQFMAKYDNVIAWSYDNLVI